MIMFLLQRFVHVFFFVNDKRFYLFSVLITYYGNIREERGKTAKMLTAKTSEGTC